MPLGCNQKINTRNLITILICIGLVVVAAIYLAAGEQAILPDKGMQPPIDHEATNWDQFTNSKYQYRFSYPPAAEISKVEEMEVGGNEISKDLMVGIPGEMTLAYFAAWPEDFLRQNNVSSSTLDSFARTVHEWQIADSNPYTEKVVGDLEGIQFNGAGAYQFTLTGSFAENYFVGPKIRASRGLSPGPHTVIILEHKGVKITILYPTTNNLSRRLIDSFELI